MHAQCAASSVNRRLATPTSSASSGRNAGKAVKKQPGIPSAGFKTRLKSSRALLCCLEVKYLEAKEALVGDGCTVAGRASI